MRLILPITLFCIFSSVCSYAQYYVRGEVRDETGHLLPGVRINLCSKGEIPYYTGSLGSFGIPSSMKIDTICLELEGYEKLKTPVTTSDYCHFKLKHLNPQANSVRFHLSSYTPNNVTQEKKAYSVMEESYSSTIENQFVPCKKSSLTGYSLHVDRASYSNIRRFINSRTKPPPDAVRIEEMLNYFNFRTKKVDQQTQTFSLHTQLTSCPWNEKNQLLFINLQAKKINLDQTPPTHLVFLVDVSGSMDMPNRLPLLKSAFKLLVENLRAKDTVSIVTYGSAVAIRLHPTSGAEKEKIIDAIEGLYSAGATPGESAIRTAYRLANMNFIKNGHNRIILATDGDFNVGQTSEKELEYLITTQRESGIYLTCLGVGMGNYKDSKLEALSKHGNGNFAYLDNEREAEKVLVEEFAQTVYTVANNVFLNVDFNPNMVKNYRLIGFDNRKKALTDSVQQLEGGEVGSGHSLLSVFEIEPEEEANEDQIAKLEVKYHLPGKTEEKVQVFKAVNNFQHLDSIDDQYQFAASVIMFGTLLKQSKFGKGLSWKELYQFAQSSINQKDLLQKEFLELIQKAKPLYSKKRSRKVKS